MKQISLAARLYLAMTACAFVMMVSPFVTSSLFRKDGSLDRLILARVESRLGDDAAVKQVLDDMKRDVGLTVTLCSPDGNVLSSTMDEPICTAGDEPRLRDVMLEHGAMKVQAVIRPPVRPFPWPRQLVALLLGSLIVVVAGFLITRSVVRPVDELVAATRALGAGQKSVRVDVDGPRELTVLAQSFNEMSARIQDQMQTQRALLSDVGHELRTPLSRLRVAVELALEGDEAQGKEMLADIQIDLNELERIVNDVLAVFRLEVQADQGVPPLRLEEVAVPDLIQASAARFASHHPAQPLTVAVDDVTRPIQADATWLRRAVDNLLDNAARYAESPTVALRAKFLDGKWKIDVEDSGRGMTEEEQKGLFKPFYRLERSRSRGKGGVGLGLVLTRRIVEAHGGELTLTSAAGQGTCVTIAVPG